MPNGRHGDHPLTDIVWHHVDVYTDEIDGLIRKIYDADSDALDWNRFYLLGWTPSEEELAELKQELEVVWDDLPWWRRAIVRAKLKLR